jgi:hypothetical protein
VLKAFCRPVLANMDAGKSRIGQMESCINVSAPLSVMNCY